MNARDTHTRILDIQHLSCSYGQTTVLDDISLTIFEGQCVALVGESGSGKSTLARVITGLKQPDQGTISLTPTRQTRANHDSKAHHHFFKHGRKNWHNRRQVQMIFQDPISSLNPRRTIIDIVAEPYAINSRMTLHERRKLAASILTQVGIDVDTYGGAHAHEISGGQAQRVAIARAIAADPRLLICDEPVSSLDVSVQATVLNLFADLRDSEQLSMLFISHDLSVVRMISDTVYVLNNGVIVESGPTEDVIHHPQHPYTQRLVDSVPRFTPSSDTTPAKHQ